LTASKRILISAALDSEKKYTNLSLIVQDTTSADTGVYKVKAVSKITTIEAVSQVNVLVAPKVTRDLKPTIQCAAGEPCKLEVAAVGTPEPDFTWFHIDHENKEVEVVSSDDINIAKNGLTYVLQINKASSVLKGKYILRLKNNAGSAEASSTLLIDDVPCILKELNDLVATEGNDAVLSITADGSPTPTVDWYRNDTKVKTDKRIVAKTEDKTFTLTFVGIKAADQGEYKAIVKNKIGQVESRKASLCVSVAPTIIKPLKDSEALEGIPFEYSCEILAYPKPEVTWFMDDTQLAENGSFSFVNNNNTYTLLIKSPTESNNANVRAAFKNELGAIETKGNLTILIPPRFVKALDEITSGSFAGTTEFITQICAKPAAKIKLLKDNKEVKSSEHVKLETEKINETTFSFRVLIDNNQATDSGIYRIEATNKCLTTKCETQFTVKGEPAFLRKPADLTVADKKQACFYCEAVGVPIPTVEWFKDGVLLEKSDSIQIDNKGKGINSLIIKSCSTSNVGSYKVKAKNESGEIEHSFSLFIDIAPFFITPLKDKIEVLAGQPVKLECTVGGTQPQTIVWDKRGEEVKAENGIEIINDGKTQVLSLPHTTMKDASAYSILVTNKLGKCQSRTDLVIKCAPVFLKKARDEQVIEKRVSRLEVEIEAFPKPSVTWYKDGKEINNNDHIKGVDAKGGFYQLVINNSSKDDTGVYTCKAVNEIGEAECSAELAIESAPNFVKKLERLGAVEQCEAEWYFGLSGLPKPEIEITKDNQVIDLAANANLYKLEELEPKLYCLKFMCINKNDVGTWRINASNSVGKATTLNKLDTMPLAAPVFVRGLTNTQLAEHVDNKIEALVSGCPFPKHAWYKNGQQIEVATNPQKYKEEVDRENGAIRLVIHKCEPETDTAMYKLTISSPGGEASSEGKYTVKGFAPKFVEKPIKQHVLQGCKASFAASADGDPMPIIKWTKNGIEVEEVEDVIEIYYDDNVDTHFLEFSETTSKHAGTYKCTASNLFGSETVQCVLVVSKNRDEVPEVMETVTLRSRAPRPKKEEEKREGYKLKHWEDEKPLTDQSVYEHRSVMFECRTAKEPEWFINDTPIDLHSSRITPHSTGKIRRLMIRDCLKSETDSVIKAKYGDNKETKAKLIVKDCPFVLRQGLKSQKVLKDSTVTLDCEIVSSFEEAFEMKWKKNGKPLEIDGKHLQYKNEAPKYTLVINGFKESDVAEYEIYVAKPDDFLYSSHANIQLDADAFATQLEDQTVFEKDTATFSCLLCNSTTEVNWTYNDKPVVESDHIKIASEENKRGLVISNCKTDDSGVVSCNIGDKLSTSAKLIVEELPCEITKLLGDKDATEHDYVSFEVTLSKPNHTVKWFLNGVEMNNNKRFKPKQVDETRFAIDIDDLDLNDAGEIKVVVFNSKGEQVTQSEANLFVKEPPLQIVKGLTNLRVDERNEAMFECKFNRAPKFDEVEWYKDDEKLSEENSRIKFLNDGKKQFLIIKDAQLADIGNYKIKVNDVESAASLKVKELPLDFTRKLEEFYNNIEKETTVLECEVNKDNIKCVWRMYGQGHIIVPNERYKIEAIGRLQRLTVSNLTLDDQQNIACIACKNNEEIVSTSGRIIVNYGPLEIVKGLDDISLNEDSDAILTVELNRENQDVEWYKDYELIHNEPKRRIYRMEKIYTLRLGEINPKDGNGIYSFKVKNLETSGVLTVIEKPIVVVSPLKDKIVVENKTVKFVVEFNKPDILSKLVWLKNNQEITDFSENYTQEEDNTKYFLTIKKAKFDDEGEYTVKVRESTVSSTANLSVTEGPLEVTKHLVDFQLKEDSKATFECEFNKANVPVTWFRNGEEIANSKNFRISIDGKRHILVINKCSPSDAGKYTVKTNGPFTTCIFSVDEIPVEFSQALEDVRVKEKETAVFTCESNKENEPNVRWYKDGVEIDEDNTKKYKYITNGNMYSLEILNASLKDITNYSIGIRGKQSAANLYVEEVPVPILRGLTDVSVFEKQEIHLECEFETPNLDAVWHLNGSDAKLMLGIDRCYSKVNGTVYHLTILDAKLDDFGEYSCTAKLSKTTCNVIVKETPVAVVKPLDNQEVVEKQTATFSCTLNKPRLQVAWYCGDKKLAQNDRIQFAQEGKLYKLIIANAQLEDKATYSIKVDDAESKAQLNVKDAPNKVKNTLSDKEAVEEDDVAFFEIELVKQIKETDPIKWTFNGRRLDLKSGNKYVVEARGNISKLLIKNVRLEDEGNYAVDVNNSSSTASLTVHELPAKFVKPLCNLVGKEDQFVSFECELSKAQWKKKGSDILVKWYKGEKEIKESSKYAFKRNGINQGLVIKELEFDDAGQYSAVVGDEEKTSAKLEIEEKDLEITSGLSDVTCIEKETAQFDCELNKLESHTGDAYPVQWYRRLEGQKEEKIQKDGRFEITTKNKKLILKINDASLEDAAIYSVKIGDLKTSAKLTVNEIPIVFKTGLADQKGKEGHSVTFECVVNRADKPVKWLVNGELIRPDGKYVPKQDKNKLLLTVNDLDLLNDDDCSITCQVGDKLKSKAKLRVIEDDIRFVERLVDAGAKEMSSTHFTCKLNKTKYRNKPKAELDIKWFIRGKQITHGGRFAMEQLNTQLGLEIKSVSYQDAGEIKCEVNGSIQTAAMLSVEEEPVVFVKKLTDLKCTEIQGKIVFECELNKLFSDVAWFKNGSQELSENDKYTPSQNGNKHYLTINDVDGKDDGEYTIVLKGKNEKKCMSILTVRQAPKFSLTSDFVKDIVVKRGQPIEMNVTYKGFPNPKLNWSFNDDSLDSTSSRIRIDNIKNARASATITKTTRLDSGKYVLTLENECGRDTCTINVKVLDRPSPPRLLKVNDITGSTMHVAWKSPEDDGGSPITGYIVEIKQLDRDMWSDLATTSQRELQYTATGLKLGKLYAYRVSAKNKYGTSDPVESIDFEAKHPFNVPDAPLNCQVRDVTATSCLLTYQPPNSDGGSPILGYIIERRDNSTNKWQRVNKDGLIEQLFVETKDLKEGTEYEYRVIAENLAGQSKPSEPCKPFKAKMPYDRPGPPLNVKYGTVTKSSIELSWSKPATDGGSPILGYKIERRNAKTLNWSSMESLGIIKDCNYTLKNLNEGQEYEFRVVACNLAGDSNPSASTGTIVAKDKIVGDKPTLLQPLKDIKLIVGETAKFVAKVKASPKPDIKWSVDERSLYNGVSTYSNETLELTLTNVQLKDEGTYKCTIKNVLGELTISAKLTVIKAPTIRYDTRFDRIIEIVTQQNLNISCEINGYPKPNVKWYKEKDEIIKNGHGSRAVPSVGEYISRLDLEHIQRNEGGKYVCTAENEVGKAEASFTVKVLDVPMPPENLKVNEVTSSSCRLTWSAPKDDGNVPVTGYYVEKFDSKRGLYIRVDKTSLTECLVEKLQKGQAYKFRVIAENKVGQSEPCEMKEQVLIKGKFDVPSAPESPLASEITNTGCRISWEEPTSNGGSPIKGYYVERKCATRWLRLNQEPEPRKYLNIRDLIQGMDYEFRVCAVNDEGEGPFSKPSDSFTAKNKYDKPDVPIYVDVRDITNTSCVVTWTPPQRTGGLPVVRYHIEMRAKGEAKFFRFTDDFISETEYEVTGLVANQEYEFRVVAENKKGQSLPSEPCRAFKAREVVPGILPEVALGPEFGNLIGSQGKIQATVTGTPVPDVKWKKGSKVLSMNSSKYSISFAQSLAVLYINNLNEDDAGQYTCEVQNSEGAASKSCRFIVYSPPAIEYDNKYKKTSVISVGSNFRIACQVSGCPKPEVVWSKDETVITDAHKAKIDNPTDLQHYLNIKQIDRFDAGSYVISATNPSGKDEAKFDLKVVDVPDKPTGPIEINLDSSLGTTVSLDWKAPKWDGGSELIGYTIEYAKILEPTYSKSLSWFRAGSVRPNVKTFVMTDLVRNCYYYFRIIAENMIGQSIPLESEKALQARPTYNVPSAPTGPLAISHIESNGCTLHWGMPTDDGGNRIHSFIIEIREKKRATWHQIDLVDVSELSLKVNRLVENNAYYFRILAKNSIGLSEPLYSDRPVVISRPPGVPDAPFPLIVSDLQSNSCTLDWKAPTWNGGEEIIGYTIEMRIGESRSGQWTKVYTTTDSYARSQQITGLTEGQEYFFRISAFNKNASSEPLTLNRAVVPKRKLTPPSPPTGPITPFAFNKNSITIQWEASKNDGGSKITRYIVLCREVNTSTWKRVGSVDVDTLSYQVEHLTENSDYHFRVVAENLIGQSEHLQTSEPIKARSPFTVPSRPVGPLGITNITDTSAIVHWKPAEHNGGSPITGYVIKRRDVTRPIWVHCGRVGIDTSSFKIKDLVVGCQYAVHIYAENSEGLSSPLESVENVVPLRPIGPPDEPANFECIGISDSSVILQWEAPNHDGGAPITAYQLEMCELFDLTGKKSEWKLVNGDIDSISSSYCVRNLEEGHKYLFRISALSVHGQGVAKKLDKPLVPRAMVQAPTQPGGPIKVLAVESDSLTIGWQASTSDGGAPLSNYIIQVRDVNKASWENPRFTNALAQQYQINNLIENNEYFVRVKAINDARLTSSALESSQPILIKSQLQVPSEPRDFKLIAQGKTDVTLEFTQSESNGGSDIFRYVIEKRDSNRVTWVIAAKVRASLQKQVYTVNVDELYSGSSLNFRVSAENQKGRSKKLELNQTVNLEKQSEVPSKPLDLSIFHKSYSSVILQWTAPVYNGNDVISEYLIEEWNSESKEWRLKAHCEPHLTSYVINNLADDLTYKYRLRAENSQGVSEPSLETFEYETLKQQSAPSNPVGPLKATVSDDQTTIELNWSRPKHTGGSPLRRYIVEKLNYLTASSPNEWSRIGVTSADETSIRLTEYFIEDSSFSFRILAENDTGKSNPLQLIYPITLEKRKKIPESPSHLRFRDKTATSINLVWKCFTADHSFVADKYRIEKRQVDATEWTRVGHSKLENFTVYDLDSNLSYYFRVIAVNTAGESRPTETHEAVSMDITNEVPSKPLGIYADEITLDSINLSWLAPRTSGAKPIIGYKLYQLAVNDRDNRHWEEIGELKQTKNLTYIVSGLSHKFVYKFRVSAFNEIGIGKPNETERIQMKKPIEQPDEPVHLAVRSVGDGEIRVSWLQPYYNGNAQITGYVIEKCEILHQNNEESITSGWLPHDTVDQFTTEYTLRNLFIGGLYSVRVAAINSAHTGKYAEIRQNVIAKNKNSVPDTPYGPLTLTNMTRENVDATWSPSLGCGSSPILSYLIEKKDLMERIWIKVARVEPKVQTYKINNLIEGHIYQLRISAENEFGKSEPLYSVAFRPLRLYEKRSNTKQPWTNSINAKPYIEDVYVVHDFSREEIFYNYRAENSSTSVWHTINFA